MQILEILESKSHNKHYLHRYYTFILSCIQINRKNINVKMISHHICPKANDLFPEYSKLKQHSWNGALLTPRQHFIAHWMLWKAYGGSQSYAFNIMKNVHNYTITSKIHESLKNSILCPFTTEKFKIQQSKRLKENNISKRPDVAEKMSNTMKLKAQNNELYTQTSEFKESHSKRMNILSSQGLLYSQNKEAMLLRSVKYKERALNKKLHMQTEYYSKFMTENNKSKSERDNVILLKSVLKNNNITLMQGWYRKSDDWINSKIEELNHASTPP